jgi:TPR repeat protein
VEANYILACEYYFGDIVDRDLDIVLDCCAHLTVRNFDIGTVVYGALMNLKSEATNEFEGDRAVMYLNYGKMLLEGNCDSSDEERGLDYINKAASDENPAALFELGLIHCNGDYCQTDMGKSIEYFTRAAELEQCDSMLTLGFLYKGI